MFYNNFRYYDPGVGRYITQDPIRLLGVTNAYSYVNSPTVSIDPYGLMPWRWDPNNGMGHHLVPRGKANSSGLSLLGSERGTPTFFPEPYKPGLHEDLHRAQRPHIGALQGPWQGSPKELIEASRKGLVGLKMRGSLKIPSTGEVLGRNLTPAQAFDLLMKWHAKQPKPKGYPSC